MIVDLVSTGKTLKENNLEIVEKISDVSSNLIVNRVSLKTKSDDINGRTKLYNSLVRGSNTPEPGIPESFNVLVKELEGLGLKVKLH